jgi:hypothetical protein
MVPLLVEYSEDDDPGCGLGVIVIMSVVAVATLLPRVLLRAMRA